MLKNSSYSPLRAHRLRQLLRLPVAMAVIFEKRAVMIMKKKLLALMKRIMNLLLHGQECRQV
jgi:hypothetical protein